MYSLLHTFMGILMLYNLETLLPHNTYKQVLVRFKKENVIMLKVGQWVMSLVLCMPLLMKKGSVQTLSRLKRMALIRSFTQHMLLLGQRNKYYNLQAFISYCKFYYKYSLDKSYGLISGLLFISRSSTDLCKASPLIGLNLCRTNPLFLYPTSSIKQLSKN